MDTDRDGHLSVSRMVPFLKSAPSASLSRAEETFMLRACFKLCISLSLPCSSLSNLAGPSSPHRPLIAGSKLSAYLSRPSSSCGFPPQAKCAMQLDDTRLAAMS